MTLNSHFMLVNHMKLFKITSEFVTVGINFHSAHLNNCRCFISPIQK